MREAGDGRWGRGDEEGEIQGVARWSRITEESGGSVRRGLQGRVAGMGQGWERDSNIFDLFRHPKQQRTRFHLLVGL